MLNQKSDHPRIAFVQHEIDSQPLFTPKRKSSFLAFCFHVCESWRWSSHEKHEVSLVIDSNLVKHTEAIINGYVAFGYRLLKAYALVDPFSDGE